MTSPKKTKSSEYILDLEVRFLDGERLTVEQIMSEYLQPKTVIDGLIAKDKVKGYMNQLKSRFTHVHGLWFGNINDQHQYGIPATKEEFEYILARYRNRVIGVVRRTVQVYKFGVSKKVIAPTSSQRLLLPNITLTEEKKK